MRPGKLDGSGERMAKNGPWDVCSVCVASRSVSKALESSRKCHLLLGHRETFSARGDDETPKSKRSLLVESAQGLEPPDTIFRRCPA